jgi:hypothetical protein
MSETIKIGGRLYSVEQGNVVAGANAILDDTKGKKQNVINKETDDELVRIAGVSQGLSDTIETILVLIPSAASALNKLADMAFVNSSVSTNTATFRGTSEAGLTEQQFLVWADGLTHDINDYVFWNTVDADGNVQFKRYKYDGTQWLYEYTLNNSSFTAAQWAAINSGITTALVAKLNDLPTNAALQAAFSAITAVIPSDATAENKLTDKAYVDGLIQAIAAIIPEEASSTNKLADKEYVGTEIAAAILASISSFKGQFTSLVELQAVQSSKDGDIGIVRTTDKDGRAVYSFYQYKNESWNAYYTLQYQNQRKPSSTGLTGNYPSNGMGRIELPRNEVEIYPLETWGMVVRNGIAYLVYSYGFKYYAVYDSVSGKGLVLENNLVSEVANYNVADIADIVETNYLNYSEAGGVFTITKPDTTTITSTELNNTELWFWGTDTKSVYNMLTQSMMQAINTIYVIQYDFTLGENITVPANCVLEFDGGSISAGSDENMDTITGNNTALISGQEEIFDSNIIIAGTWNIENIYDAWFENGNNLLSNILVMNSASIQTNIYISKNLIVYPTSFDGFLIKSNTTLYNTGSITKGGNEPVNSILGIYGAENVSIIGGSIIGNADAVSTSEYGHGIYVQGSRNINIFNVTVEKCHGDGIDFYPTTNNNEVVCSSNCRVENCIVAECGRDGVGAICIDGLIIENCTIKNNGIGNLLGSAMDLEPNNSNEYIRNVTIRNCKISGCYKGILFSCTSSNVENKNFVVDNVDITVNRETDNNSSVFVFSNISNLVLKNSKISSLLGSAANSFAQYNCHNIRLENNNISVNTIMSINAELINNTIVSSAPQVLSDIGGCIVTGNKITQNYSSVENPYASVWRCTGKVVMRDNVVVATRTIDFGTSSATEGSVVENNIITAAGYFRAISCGSISHATIRNNIFTTTVAGEVYRNHFDFANLVESEFSGNVINIQTNNNCVCVDAGSNDKVGGNVFNIPNGYDKALFVGICTKTTNKNREGDMIFDNGKPIWWNGSAWVDATGTPV